MNLKSSKAELELKYRQELLNAKIEEAEQVLEDISALRIDKRNEQTSYGKNKFERLIKEKESEFHKLREIIEEFEKQITQNDFPLKLYHYFREFNFKQERKTYKAFREKAKKQRIGSFVIHSDGHYKKTKEQQWLWRCILLSYLSSRQREFIELPFRHQTTIRQLFDTFRSRITDEVDYNIMNDHIGTNEIHLLLPSIEAKLELSNVIIIIYLSEDLPAYKLIHSFISQVWKPICRLVANRDNNRNWLKLFIVDNEVLSISKYHSKNYYVNSIEESLKTHLPLILNKSSINPKEFQEWLTEGRYFENRVFYQFEHECRSFLDGFKEYQDYLNYLPSCKTIEGLFETICSHLPNRLLNVDFKRLMNEYAEKI